MSLTADIAAAVPARRWPEPRAMLRLIKPITWFPPMWAYRCGLVSAGAAFSGHWGVVFLGILLAPGGSKIPCVIAYHEIVEAPVANANYDPLRCDVIYDGVISPDFYGWVFPHGKHASSGMGIGIDGVDLKAATALLRQSAGIEGCKTIRREGAPIPLKPTGPLRQWPRCGAGRRRRWRGRPPFGRGDFLCDVRGPGGRQRRRRLFEIRRGQGFATGPEIVHEGP